MFSKITCKIFKYTKYGLYTKKQKHMIVSTWIKICQKLYFAVLKSWFLCNTNSNLYLEMKIKHKPDFLFEGYLKFDLIKTLRLSFPNIVMF